MAPLTATWRKITEIQGPQPRPRHGHRAAVVKDFIIVFGGGNEGMIEGLYVYNTSKNQWFVPATRGDIPASRAAFGLVALDNRLLMFGGMLEYGQNCNNLFELQVSRWEWKNVYARPPEAGSLPLPRFGHSFTLLGERIYLFGGLSAEVVKKKSKPKYLNDLYTLNIRDIDAPLWEAHEVCGPSPSPRESHTTVAYTDSDTGKSFLILYGGMNGTRLGDVWFLNCDTMSWIQPYITGIAPIPRSLHIAAVIGHRMFIFGGWVPLAPDDCKVTHYTREWKCTNTLAFLDLKTLSWNMLPSQENNTPRARAGHCAVALDTRLYIWSGRDGYSKRWNNQICCKDFWFLETAVPAAPLGIHLNRATPEGLHISWENSPTAESYVVQVQKYTSFVKEPMIIDDPPPLYASKQKSVNYSVSPRTTSTSSPSAITPTITPNVAVPQVPLNKKCTSEIEPPVTHMKSAVTNEQDLRSYTSTPTSKIQPTLSSLVARYTDTPAASIIKTAIPKRKLPISTLASAANATAIKSVCVSKSNTLTSNSVGGTASANSIKAPTYILSKGALHVAPTASAYQNNTTGSSLQINSDNQVAVVTSVASTCSSSTQMTAIKPIFTSSPVLASSTGNSANTANLKSPIMPLLGANSEASSLKTQVSSLKTPVAANTSSGPRKIITILQPIKQSVVQQNVELPTQGKTAQRQEGTPTPIRRVIRVGGSGNALPLYRAVTTSAGASVAPLQMQKSANTIVTPVRFVKTSEGAKYVLLQSKSTAESVPEQGNKQISAAPKILKIGKLNLESTAINTAGGTKRALVLKQITVPASSSSESEGKAADPAPADSSAADEEL